MCGIVGYIGRRDAAPIVIEGLKKLEYRGYDSFGIAVLENSLDGKVSPCTEKLSLFKRKGRISEIDSKAYTPKGRAGIGHTRWATHGVPNDVNAHPHCDCTGKIGVVHNGIIENYIELRDELSARGHIFKSDTDTEVVPHLIEEFLNESHSPNSMNKPDEKNNKYSAEEVLSAVRKTTKRIKGSFALLILVSGCNFIVAAKRLSPLVIGIGDGEIIASSDMTPILDYTQDAVFLEDEDIALLTSDSMQCFSDGHLVKREAQRVEWDVASAKKGGYDYFMEKEIFEQPDVFYNSFVQDISEKALKELRGVNEITVVACGSSYHAAFMFRYMLEKYCGIFVHVEIASEYLNFKANEGVMIAVTQSGETADTLAAIRHAKSCGCKTIAITNVLGSSAARTADYVLYTRAGPEISVAATKSFIGQTAVLFRIACELSKAHGEQLLNAFLGIHPVIESVLLYDGTEAAKICMNAQSLFYVGRGVFYPVALEGALKMKEITYIHAEGYAAGELKHGPFSLLCEETPVIALCTQNAEYPVMISNLREIKSRGAPLVAIGSAGDTVLSEIADLFIPLPPSEEVAEIISAVIVLQIIAYKTAVLLGRDVDKPRNLAKSVTVI